MNHTPQSTPTHLPSVRGTIDLCADALIESLLSRKLAIREHRMMREPEPNAAGTRQPHAP
jgi:hypothetical protein